MRHFLLVVLALALAVPPAFSSDTGKLRLLSDTAKTRVVDSYQKAPLSFEINRGQIAKPVRFLSRGAGYNLFLTATEAVLSLHKTLPNNRSMKTRRYLRPVAPELFIGPPALPPAPAVLRMKLIGANKHPQIEGKEQLPAVSNYFINSKSQWRSHVRHFGKVLYNEVYPGIDLIYYGTQQHLEYDFIVAPGADPNRIRISFAGAQKISINPKGELVLETGSGRVVQRVPVIYQEIGGRRQGVAGRYVLHRKAKKSGCEVGFVVAAHDRTKPLIIDPILFYSTYLGGSNSDSATGVAVDASLNTYVTGYTYSLNFPTVAGAFQSVRGGYSDAFVAKFNAVGALVYCTYLGSSGTDRGWGIAVDASGNVYITGSAEASFPTTAGAFRRTLAGGVFVTKLNSTGTDLIYSTFLGEGTSYGIAVDGAGNACVTGTTPSTSFPAQNPLQQPPMPTAAPQTPL